MITEDMTAAEKAADWLDQLYDALREKQWADSGITELVVNTAPTVVSYFLKGE